MSTLTTVHENRSTKLPRRLPVRQPTSGRKEVRRILHSQSLQDPQPSYGQEERESLWRNEIAAAGFHPELDLEMLLGSPPEQMSSQIDSGTRRELYIYLKNLRRALGRSEATFDLAMVNLLDRQFPGFGDQVWNRSKEPLAGYVGTSKGHEARKRLAEAGKLGLEKTRAKRWRRKFIGSDVIFFSGHHYGEGDFDNLDIKKIRFKAPQVKLIMISSCSGLEDSAIKLWRNRFPNAYVLGWKPLSPLSQKGMMRKFLSRLPEDLILENKSDIETVLSSWRAYVESLAKDTKTVRPSGLGYATPDGTRTYYVETRNKWKWVVR